MANKLHCPNCKSTNITITTESTVNGGITSNHGGVSTTSMTSTHRNYWICSDCGTKFRNIQNLEEEINKNKKTPVILMVLALLSAIFSIFWFARSGAFLFGGFAIILGCGGAVGCLAFIIAAYYYKNQRKKMIEELAYLKENCFD